MADPFPLPARLAAAYAALRAAPRAALCVMPAEDWPDARTRLEMAGGEYAALVLACGSVAVLSIAPVPGRPADGLRRDDYHPLAAAEAVRAAAGLPGLRVELSEGWAAGAV